MRCSVPGCKSTNNSKASELSFFKFPSDAGLQKKWVKFCRKENINPKTGSICMEHFHNDDFENNMEYQMGFTMKRRLKRGAVPTIYKASVETSERSERIERRENKRIVSRLLQESNATTSNANEDVTEVNPKNLRVNEELSVLEQLLSNTKRGSPSSPAQSKSPTTDDNCFYYSGDEEESGSELELEQRKKVKFIEFINEEEFDECNVAMHQAEDSNNEMNEDDVVKPVNREQLMLLHTTRSIGTETDNILKNAEVQTDVVYLDKTTCGFIAVSREDKQFSFFLCCLYCTEMYSICDWKKFIIHLNAEHDALEQMEAEIDIQSNWPHTAGARVLLRKSKAKQGKACVDEDTQDSQMPKINVGSPDTQSDVSNSIFTSNNLPEPNEISVRDADSNTMYDNLNFSDSDTDSDTERTFKVNRYDPNFDHCYSQKSSEFLRSQPRVHELRFERTDSAIIMDLLELLKNFPALWYPRSKSEQAYDSGISTLCKILSVRWDLNLSEEGLQRTLEKIKSWYRSILMYSNVRNASYSMVCTQKYVEYYKVCSDFMPHSNEEEPPEVLCEECNENCYDYAKLQMHAFRLHGADNLPYECGLCGEQFIYVENLQPHLTRHKPPHTLPRAVIVLFPKCTVKKRLPCEKCHRIFYHEAELLDHMEQHSKDIRPYVCEICDLRFSLASTYSAHKSEAHKLPKYKCDICGKEFNTGHYFNDHMKRHRGQFDYMCEVCGKMFINQGKYMQHRQCIHGDRAYCNICDHNFSSHSALRKHQKHMHQVLEGTIEQLEERRKLRKRARGVKKNEKKKRSWHTHQRKYERVDENPETKKYRLRCPLCPKLYRQYDSLYSHTQKIHGKNVRNERLLSQKIKNARKQRKERKCVGSTYPENLYKNEQFDVSETMAATTSITSTNNADSNGASTECRTKVLITEHKVISVSAENIVMPSISTNNENEPNESNEGCNDFVMKNMPLVMSPEQKTEQVTREQLKLADEKLKESDNAFDSLFAHDVEDAEFEMVINCAM